MLCLLGSTKLDTPMLPLLPDKPVLVDAVVRVLVLRFASTEPDDVDVGFLGVSFRLRMVAVDDVAGEEMVVCL